MEQPAYFSEARKSFHAALLNSILRIQDQHQTFEDVAIHVAKYLEEIVIPFKRVYLLNAPGREVFEIYPKLERCD